MRIAVALAVITVFAAGTAAAEPSSKVFINGRLIGGSEALEMYLKKAA